MKEQEIRKLFDDHKVPVSKGDVWMVQGTPVILHAALERLAAALDVKWEDPTVVRAERDEAVVLVFGSTESGDKREWSFGEAAIQSEGKPGNYKVSGRQAAYVYAMAEKRAKDRVILKLARITGAVAEGELEADKGPPQADPEPAQVREPKYETPEPAVQVDTDPAMTRFMKEIEAAPANTDSSAVKMARVVQGMDSREAVDKFLAQKNTLAARAALKTVEASTFTRWLEKALAAYEK